ncbi:MAG: protein-L-isoaspartate O-methyltransferase [Kiloniellales bacterium]|nr:protein-L-isoaspartate O-methyltransferase [Kiloniellales bacterium]
MDFAAARANMVDCQLRTNKLRDARLIEAFETVPRELFVPENLRPIAYIDEDLSLGNGRYLLEPMVLARLLQAAEISPQDLVLEVAGASGYGTAVLSRLGATIVSLESDRELAAAAASAQAEVGIDNVLMVEGPLDQGYAKQAPYNVIVINGAVGELPETITDQLAEGGRLVTVLRKDAGPGQAVLVERHGTNVSSRVLFDAATPVLPEFERAPGFVF